MKKEKETVGLKRCPFCRSRAAVRGGERGIVFFECPECGACVRFKNIRYPLKNQVDDPVAAWNRRG